MLLTDWHVLATEGETIDGRVIEKQWLIDAAETYDPDYYEAVIDAEHDLDWFGSYGHVYDTRLNTNNSGETILEGRLRPNMRCIEQYQRGQRMHFSIWIEEDFRGTGKAYLFRLALTDTPASVGTSRLKLFSISPRMAQNSPRIMTEPKPFSMNLEGDEASLFKKFMAWLKPNQTDPATPAPEQDDDTMTQDQLNQITDAIKAQSDQFAAALQALKPAEPAAPAEPEAPAAPAPEQQFNVADVMAELKKITAKQDAHEKQFAALANMPAGTTNVPAQTGGADSEKPRDVF